MQVVDANEKHVHQFLSKKIRQDDLDEWFAASGGRPVGDVLSEILSTPHLIDTCRALLNEAGECICLWGVTPGPVGPEGIVWLIATEEAEKHGKHIHRYWPREVAMMHMRHSVLLAIAYGHNALHLSWLEAIGFTAVGAQEVGPSRLPFITFMRSMSCATQ